ncbi:MAG: hypothetical protein VXA48_17485 [Deltaproteobacteria bacterium]
MDHVKKNPDHVDLLEDLTATGTWYLDLKTMTFTEMSEKNYEIYGISKEKPPSYEDFLFNYVFLEDQPYCERKRLEILQAEGPEKFLLEFRIIKQDTGVVHQQRVLVQRVEDGENNLIGLRGATTDLGPVLKMRS